MLGGSVARLKPRECGAERIVTLHPELNIVVRFTVPFPVEELEIEAAANASRAVLVKSPAVAARYGLAAAVLSAEEAGATALRVHLVEAAVKLWKEWNVALGSDDVSPITPESASQVLTDPVCHRLWADAYFASCSMERDEGNVSAVSPSMPSDEAATTAAVARSSTPPVTEGSPGSTDASARPSRTNRRRRKASSSAGSAPPQAS